MASKRAARRRKCGTKVRFDQEQDAKTRAVELSRQTGSQWTPYRCEHCGKWHVGHTPHYVRLLMDKRRYRAK